LNDSLTEILIKNLYYPIIYQKNNLNEENTLPLGSITTYYALTLVFQYIKSKDFLDSIFLLMQSTNSFMEKIYYNISTGNDLLVYSGVSLLFSIIINNSKNIF
jgi:hypothetical protein